jgi:hypothetical protein
MVTFAAKCSADVPTTTFASQNRSYRKQRRFAELSRPAPKAFNGSLSLIADVLAAWRRTGELDAAAAAHGGYDQVQSRW